MRSSDCLNLLESFGGGAATQVDETYANVSFPYTLPSVSFYGRTDETAELICTHDGSNDAVWSKEVLFGGYIFTKLH
jgi:hypothetical protein